MCPSFFDQLSLEKRHMTHGTQMPYLNSTGSKILQSPNKHGEIKHWKLHLCLLDSAAHRAHQYQRRCWRLYGVQIGKDEMWWSDCPTHAANGAVARVKSALSAEPFFLNMFLSKMQSSTFFICDSSHVEFQIPSNSLCMWWLLIQECECVCVMIKYWHV